MAGIWLPAEIWLENMAGIWAEYGRNMAGYGRNTAGLLLDYGWDKAGIWVAEQ